MVKIQPAPTGNQATVGCVATVTSPAAAAPTPAPVAAAPTPAPVAAGPVKDYQGRICNQGNDRAAEWVLTRAVRTEDNGMSSWGRRTWTTPEEFEITALSPPLCKGIAYPNLQKKVIAGIVVPLLRVPEGTVVPSRFNDKNGPFEPGKGLR